MGKIISRYLCYALLAGSVLISLSLISIYDVSAEAKGEALGEQGKKLHTENCLICHKPEKYYLRKDRKVKTWPELILQIRKCQLDTGEEWSAEEFVSVVEYVNKNYYKFNQ